MRAKSEPEPFGFQAIFSMEKHFALPNVLKDPMYCKAAGCV
jgi:hypothetical protein